MDIRQNVQVQSVELSDLKDHPREFEFFSEPTEAELAALADDMRERGQQDPIHICPDGTILRGHRRVRAARRLSWTEIDAVVRHDISNPLQADAIDDLILDNVVRQQLGDLALARCYKALKENADELDIFDGDIRDHLAEKLGCNKSGRTLDRLVRLLDLPRDIQDMVSSRVLTKQHGHEILNLDRDERERLYSDLRGGMAVREVLSKYRIIRQKREKTSEERARGLLEYLRDNVDVLAQDIPGIAPVNVLGCDSLDLLEQSTDFLQSWADRKRAHRESEDDGVFSLLDDLD